MNISSSTLEKGFIMCTWLVFALFFSYWLSLVFANSPNIAGVENNIVYFVQRILSGSSLYSNPEEAPYAIAQYSPLYYCLVAAVAKTIGINAEDITTLFILNRVVSLVLILSISCCVYHIGKKGFEFTRKKSLLLAAAVFIFMEISSFARPDSLANATWFLSFLIFLVSQQKRNPSLLLVASALVATIAVFSKQSAITLPTLCAVWFLYMRLYRFFLIYTISFLGFLVIGIITISSTVGLWVFYMNVIKGIDNGINLTIYFNYIVQRFLASQGLLWIALMAPILIMLFKKKGKREILLAMLIAGQFVASCLSAMKYGASSNYFTEWWILILIGSACCWPYFSKAVKLVDPGSLYVMLFTILFFRTITIFYPFYQELFAKNKIQRQQKYQTEQKVASFIRTDASENKFLVYNNVFSPDSYLNNLLFKEAIMPQNDIVVLGTYNRKVFNYSQFLRQIKNGEIRYLIINTNEARPGFLIIDTANFQMLTMIDNYRIFQHKKYVQ